METQSYLCPNPACGPQCIECNIPVTDPEHVFHCGMKAEPICPTCKKAQSKCECQK